jgi:hypothetical protein
MAKLRTLEICGLNIAMHSPHPTTRYLELFRHAQANGQRYRQGELHGLMLGPWFALSEQETIENILVGEIYRFVNINPNEPWFDTQTSRPATEEEMGMVNIPSHLRAHLQQIPFVFNARTHQLWFVSHDGKSRLGPKPAERFFQTLLLDAAMRLHFPEVAVTAIPSDDSLNEIFAIHSLKRLIIELKRPNPDDGAVIEQQILGRMEAQHIRSTRTEHVASTDGSIQPDVQTRQLAQVAAMNGSVTGIGKTSEGLTMRETTTDKPKRIYERVNSAIETAMDVLKRLALPTI